MNTGLAEGHALTPQVEALHVAIGNLTRASAALVTEGADAFVGDQLHHAIAADAYNELLAVRRVITLLELHFADLMWRYTKASVHDPKVSTDDDPFQTVRRDCRMTSHAVNQAYTVGAEREHLPLATQAVVEGRIGMSHLGYIAGLATTIFANPQQSRTELFDESALVGAAEKLNVLQFRRVCEDVRHQAYHADFVDGEMRDDCERYLEMKNHEDGWLEVRGGFDPEAACLIRSVIEPLAKPDGKDDHREVAQRNADALVEACHHVLDQGSLPQSGGVRPHLYVTCTVETLRDIAGAPAGDLQGVTAISGTKVERLSCDSTIMRVLVNAKGMPVDVGRAHRVVPPSVRRALIARDRGCVWPGCGRSASWTQAHHIEPWAVDGRTDAKNLVLLCHRHHWMVHEGCHKLLRREDGEVVVIAPSPGWWRHNGRDPTTFRAA